MSAGKVALHDKIFSIYISADEISAIVKRIAGEMESELVGEQPVFIGVLNGAVFFVTDLLRELQMNCEMGFIGVSSYEGMVSSGEVKLNAPLQMDIKDKVVVLVEDIIDSGRTVQWLIKELEEKQPKSLKVATLLYKPDAFKGDYKIDYIGREIPNDFVVGYGMDYDGLGRNLKDIYTII